MHLPHPSLTASFGVLFFGLALTLLSCRARSSLAAASLQDQYTALTKLYSALGGQDWVSSSGWTNVVNSTAAVAADHCSWQGIYCCGGALCPASSSIVRCTEPCAVWGIFLANNNLAGCLEDVEVWDDLDTVQVLNLQGDVVFFLA